MAPSWKTAWVTGASSGIGRSVAIELARQGVAVAASARRGAELEGLAREVPGITPLVADVTDLDAMKRVGADVAARIGPIDLAFFNAGIGERMGARDFSADLAGRTMAVNYQGLVNGIEAVLPAMMERGAGHIALMSSIAGYRGLPRAAAYSASKAAVIALAESLEPELDAMGLNISVINPGFIATPMTAKAREKQELPYILSVEDCARRIVRGLATERFEVAFPWQMVAMAKLARILPYPAYFWFMSRQIGAGATSTGESGFTHRQP